MTKRKNTAVVNPLHKPVGTTRTSEDNLRLAQRKVQEANQKSGKKRVALAQQALAISPDCVEAYLVLAEETNGYEKRIPTYRKAVEVGQRLLGSDWEKKCIGKPWSDTEARSMLRALAGLAMALQWEDELDEALSLYEKIMELNPDDNMGVRYRLASCLYEAECGPELEKLLKDYKDDTSAALLYTKALHLFRKDGDSKPASKALLEAFESNHHVPTYLSDAVELPEETAKLKDEEAEAIAYRTNNDYHWYDTEGALPWMVSTLADEMRKTAQDKKLVEEVITSLQSVVTE